MRKPEFEQFRRSLIRRAKAIPQQAREPYRLGIVKLLEDTGLFLIKRARKDGHDEALLEIHGSWVGTDFSPDAMKAALSEAWPGSVFGAGVQNSLVESEEEIVTLQFAWDAGNGQFLTGRIKVTV